MARLGRQNKARLEFRAIPVQARAAKVRPSLLWAARVDNMNITPVALLEGGRLPRFNLWGMSRSSVVTVSSPPPRLQRALDRIESHVRLSGISRNAPTLDGIACVTISEDFAHF